MCRMDSEEIWWKPSKIRWNATPPVFGTAFLPDRPWGRSNYSNAIRTWWAAILEAGPLRPASFSFVQPEAFIERRSREFIFVHLQLRQVPGFTGCAAILPRRPRLRTSGNFLLSKAAME